MWISWTLGLQSIAQTSTNKQVFRTIQAYQFFNKPGHKWSIIVPMAQETRVFKSEKGGGWAKNLRLFFADVIFARDMQLKIDILFAFYSSFFVANNTLYREFIIFAKNQDLYGNPPPPQTPSAVHSPKIRPNFFFSAAKLGTPNFEDPTIHPTVTKAKNGKITLCRFLDQNQASPPFAPISTP